MEKLFIKKIKKLKSLKSKIEKAFDIKLRITKTDIEIEGKEGLSEYLASKAIEALDMGFSLDSVLQLKNEDFMFDKINLKNHLKDSRIIPVKSRLIGRQGKAKKTLENLSECEIEIKDHNIGIIGKTNNVVLTKQALIKLIQGSPHSKVYAFLERNKKMMFTKLEEEENFKELGSY